MERMAKIYIAYLLVLGMLIVFCSSCEVIKRGNYMYDKYEFTIRGE